ncbi:MAG: hypothetical protein ACOYD5_03785 [Negativicutes bacterium]|jgi:hypothetical protein
MKIDAKGVKPEIVAAITAAVYAMMGTRGLALRIKRTSNAWAQTGRQKNMNSH